MSVNELILTLVVEAEGPLNRSFQIMTSRSVFHIFSTVWVKINDRTLWPTELVIFCIWTIPIAQVESNISFLYIPLHATQSMLQSQFESLRIFGSTKYEIQLSVAWKQPKNWSNEALGGASSPRKLWPVTAGRKRRRNQGENPSSDWSRILRCEQYPLVICYIAVERATFFHWKIKEHPLFQWSCSIAMLNYQRVHLEPDWYILRHNAFLSIANMISVLLLYNGRVQYGIYWYIGISNTQTKLDFSWWTK